MVNNQPSSQHRIHLDNHSKIHCSQILQLVKIKTQTKVACSVTITLARVHHSKMQAVLSVRQILSITPIYLQLVVHKFKISSSRNLIHLYHLLRLNSRVYSDKVTNLMKLRAVLFSETTLNNSNNLHQTPSSVTPNNSNNLSKILYLVDNSNSQL